MNFKQRISAQDALKHRWFKENESQKMFNEINDENTMKTLEKLLKNFSYSGNCFSLFGTSFPSNKRCCKFLQII